MQLCLSAGLRPPCVADKLVQQDLPCIDANTRPYFSDFLDHVRHLQAIANGLHQILTSVFKFSNLLEQQRTGIIARQLAAWFCRKLCVETQDLRQNLAK